MPEITDAQYREYQAYSALGTPEDVSKRVRDLEDVRKEAADRRTKLKEAEKRIADLEAKTPEGAVILTGEDAKAYEAIQAAGGLKEANAKLGKLEELEKKDAKRNREDAIRATAKAENWDEDVAVKALSRDAEFAGLALETREEEREVQVSGRAEKRKMPVGYVTVDGKAVSVASWIKEHADHLIPTLTTASKPSDTGREMPAARGRSAPPGPLTTEDYNKAVANTADYTL